MWWVLLVLFIFYLFITFFVAGIIFDMESDDILFDFFVSLLAGLFWPLGIIKI